MSNKWYVILDEVRNARGKEKQSVLSKHKDNLELQKVLSFLNNPRITTGISKKKLYKIINESPKTIISNLDELMTYLENNNTGKDDNIVVVNHYLKNINNELEREFTKGIILKDLPIGISSTTINKVWPGLVDVFKLMKGKAYEGQDIKDEFTITLKLDGNSATVFNLPHETYILSRSGAKIEGLEYIEKYYRDNLPTNYVYCGELLKKNFDKLPHGPLFQETNGIVNSKIEDKSGLQHVVFDMVPYDEYKSQKFTKTFKERRKLIEDSIKYELHPYNSSFMDVEYIPAYYTGENLEMIQKYLDTVIDIGLEGLMVNINDAKYKFGPTPNLLKVKDFYTMDLLVKDIKEHIRGNKVGAIVVDYKGYDVGVSGIKDNDRVSWWQNPNEIVGKIVEIKYFRETKDKHGNLSLRFPSVVRIREDKTFEDVSYE